MRSRRAPLPTMTDSQVLKVAARVLQIQAKDSQGGGRRPADARSGLPATLDRAARAALDG